MRFLRAFWHLLSCGLRKGTNWTLRMLRHLIAWLRRISPPVGAMISRELLQTGLCCISTYGGVCSSSTLLNARVLPLVYGSMPANLVITPDLALALTVLVVTIQTYDELLQSYRPAWTMRLLDCFCAGLLWPYWISTPVIRWLKGLRRKKLPSNKRRGSHPRNLERRTSHHTYAAPPVPNARAARRCTITTRTILREERSTTMDHPNLDLINQFFAAYGKRDLPGLRDVLADNTTWTFPGPIP